MINMIQRLSWRIVFALSLLLLISACAQKQHRFELAQQANEKKTSLVWPMAPETPRYRYLGAIWGETNFKEIKGSEGSLRKGVNWLGSFIFGDDTPLVLYRPQSGVYDEKNKRILITDIGHKKVFVFDLAKGRLETWEGGLNQPFITPIAIVVLKNNQVLVTDADQGFILRFDSTGKYLGSIGENKLSRPTGIAYDAKDGRLFVADSQTHQIHVFAESGKWLFAFGGKGAANGKLNSPTHLAYANGVLHVSDTLNARIQLFDKTGKWLRSFGKRGLKVGNTPRPKGIAVDSDANIYVVESYYDHLLMFDSKGQGLMAIGGTGSKPGQFDLPAGVWVDQTDKIYVADMFNQRVEVFQYLSTVKTDRPD